MSYKRYKFIRELNVGEGTFPVGATVTVMGDRVFYNDGMVQPYYRNMLLDILEKEKKDGFHYLREIPIPYNKV